MNVSFKILKKCQSKLDCLIFEILFIRELEPKLNKKSDSIRAKVLPIHSLLILFLSPQRFFYYSSEIFSYCFYENILEF